MLRLTTLLTVALLAGCSSSSSDAPATDAGGGDAADVALDTRAETHPTPGDAAPVDDAGTDTAGGCNSLANVAIEVTENDVNTDLPLGAGGLIADGVYVLTEITKYTGPTGKTGPGTLKRTETISLSNVPTGVDVQGVRKDGDAAGYAYTAESAPSGGALKYKVNCPAVGDGVTYDFDADPDKFVLYDKTAHIGYHYSFKFHITSP